MNAVRHVDFSPAAVRRNQALRDAEEHYWRERARIIAEFDHAKRDIQRRFEAGEFA